MDALERTAQRLSELAALRRRRDHLTGQLTHASRTLSTAQHELRTTLATASAEGADVTRLETFTARRLWESVKGSREIALTRERTEAARAARKAAEAQERVKAAEDDVLLLTRDIASLGDLDAQYAEAIAERQAALESTPTPQGQRLTAIAHRFGELDEQARELDEAIAAGQAALGAIAQLRERLSSASGWSTYDTFFGGELISSLTKHDRMDEAAALAREAERAVERFSRELGDVGIGAISGMLAMSPGNRLFDVWFDNIFTDYANHQKIRDSQAAADNAVAQVQQALHECQHRRQDLTTERASLDAERLTIVTP